MADPSALPGGPLDHFHENPWVLVGVLVLFALPLLGFLA